MGVSLRAAHRQAAARVNGDGPEVARSILICLQSEGKKGGRKNEETDGNESLVFCTTIYQPQQLAILHAKA